MIANASGSEIPERLPVVPLRSTVIFPMGVIGVQIGMMSTIEMLAAHPEPVLLVAVVPATGGPDEPIAPAALEKVATLARLSDRLNLPGGSVQATIEGLRRIRLVRVEEKRGYLVASARPVREIGARAAENEETITRILVTLEALAEEVDRVPREVPRILRMNVADASRFADLVATLANFSVRARDEVLQRLDVRKRLAYILGELDGQLRRARRVEAEAAEAPSPEAGGAAGVPTAKAQESAARRATELRHRIKVLQSELGEIDPVEREAVELGRRVETADLPARAAARARAEIERLRAASPASPQAGEIRGYLDWLLHIPWRGRATDGPGSIDLTAVEHALDDELLDLEEPKERLLDYLAVARLRGDLRGPIPCLVGPPGVGKTTFVHALARGLGRPVARIDLGGRGEPQLIGSRRTRATAEPGKIVEALREVGVLDPVLLLEEMDLIGLGKVEGDPIEAMEQALAWDSRHEFLDRYIDIPVDLSEAIIVATAQDFYRIPRDLRELMVEIRIAGYTPEEKVEIAREKMLPRLIAEHGLEPGDVAFSDNALYHLARGYARDAGLGLLRRMLATLLRTRARAKAQGDTKKWTFTPDRIERILGLPRYIATAAENAPEVGVVTGLAWTAAGGEIMFIEALRMPGTGRLIITGFLGDVMRESVNAAYSYVRSRGEMLQIPERAFKDSDVHVHFPVGAIPKDGPSAGIAVTLAIASTLSNRPVRHDIAMTGEVTLRGKVLEIGGVKEKVLAAHRAGIDRVILPRGNERDLRDVPEATRKAMEFLFVERMEEVLELALLEHRERRKRVRTARSPGKKSDRATRPATAKGAKRPRAAKRG
ncbi:MAG TPA: S16 family serine protease [Longimicrobiales bacterium]